MTLSAVGEKEDSHQWSLVIAFKRVGCGEYNGAAIFPRTDCAEAAERRQRF